MISNRSRYLSLVGGVLALTALTTTAKAVIQVEFGTPGVSVTPNPNTWNAASNVTIGIDQFTRVNVIGPQTVTVNSFIIGPDAGIQGELRLLGSATGNVTVTATGGTSIIGQNGVGIVVVSGGADFTTAGVIMGSAASSNSLVNVTGAGSTWTAGTLDLGGSGAASLQISAGAQVTTTSVLAVLNAGSSAFLDVTGANSTFTTGNFTAFQNSFSMSATNGGKITINNNFTLRGNNNNNLLKQVFVDGAGSEFKVVGNTIIGDLGDASLSVGNGGKIDVQSLALGTTANGVNGDLYVGPDGSASVLVAEMNRGTYTQEGGTFGASFLNIATQSQERYTVNISGGITQAFDIKVSGGGQGKVNVTGGLLKAFGTLYVYGNFSGEDIVDVNGNTADVEAVNLRIGGLASNAIMRVRGGADLLVTNQLVVGDVSGSNSRLEISGTGTTATIAQAKIGDEVAGNLRIFNNAYTTITDLNIGGPGKGVVKVDTGAYLTGQTLEVGNGDATIDELTIESSATVDYSQISFFSDAKVTLLNGTLAYAVSTVIPENFKFYAGTLKWKGDQSYVAGSAEEAMLNGNGTIKIGQTFYITGEANFTTPLEINGGTLRVGYLGEGFFEFTKGKLHVDTYITIDNGQFFGNELVLRQETLYQADEGFSNYGTVSGNGRVIANFTNGGTGKVKVNLGQTIDFSGSEHFNGGTFELGGGTLRLRSYLFNSANGIIKGYGTLDVSNDTDAGTFINAGQLQLTGNATIIGDVENVTGSKIAISGAASNVFQGKLKNNSNINVASGASLVVLGEYSGAGTTTGTGKIFFEGGVNPGNSPASFFFDGDIQIGPGALNIEIGGLTPGTEHDTFDITGTLTIQGAPLNVVAYDLGSGLFKPKAGDSFDILDFATVVGTFSSINLFALDAGLIWDTSALYTTGTISVALDPAGPPAIPEPASLGVLGLGLAGLLLRRRR